MAIKNTKVINLYGAPCSGKSTLALKLTTELKVMGIDAMYVEEYAKGLTYEEHFYGLKNQIKIFAEQHNLMLRVQNKVDWIITDSPFPMGLTYLSEPNAYLSSLVFYEYSKFNNYDFYLPMKYKYKQEGRSQTEEESKEKAIQIVSLLEENIPVYHEVQSYDINERVKEVFSRTIEL